MSNLKIISVMLILLIIANVNYSETETKNVQLSNNSKNINNSDSYAENVHMYICIEALKLLKDEFPQMNWSEFDNHIGTMDDIGTRQWQMGKITTGAYREDVEDVVFDIRGPFNFFTSASHFWDSDDRTNGDHSLTNLNIAGIMYDFPNSYTKLLRYKDGNWKRWDGSQYRERKFIVYNSGDGLFRRFSYHLRGLIDLYRTNRIWYEDYINTLGQTYQVKREVTIPNYLKNIIVWEVIGRKAHLIQDISIGAHNHEDVHPHLFGGECYHDYIDNGGYNNYNWLTAKNNGGFINPYESGDDPLRYIMYSTSQLGDHFPSSPDCLEIPQQHYGDNNLPGGTYPILNNYYQDLGPPPPFIADVNEEGRYCFNHAIRATAALYYWFGVEAGIITTDPLAYPSIHGFTKNLPDMDLYKGETLIINADASGSNLTYNWFIKVCDTNNRCTLPIPGISTNQIGNSFYLSNVNFMNRYTCSYYDSLCNIGGGSLLYERPLYFKVGVIVTNQFGTVTKYYNPAEFFYPKEILRPPPPISGCPFILVKNEDMYIYENNVLVKNNFIINQDKDSEDKYFIRNMPFIDYENKSISLAIKEINTDTGYFDKINLIAVDHPLNTKAFTDENNNIGYYFIDDISAPAFARLNDEDVTENLIYDTAYSKSVKGKEKDILQIKFSDFEYYNNSFENTEDSIALIFDPYNYDVLPDPHIVKREAGEIIAYDQDGNLKPGIIEFAIRQMRSEVVVPLFKNKGISFAEINWKRGFDVSYVSAARVYYGGFNLHNLNLTEALDHKSGDVTELLLSKDNIYLESDSSTFLTMKFKIPDYEPSEGMMRDYLFVVNGRYIRPEHFLTSDEKENGIQITDKPEKRIFTDKLYNNYPNPFNPMTKISYEISNGNKLKHVKLNVYNILGKQVASLVNASQTEGIYSVNFNASQLPSGFYFYVLEITGGDNKFIESRKMILLK